MATFDNTTKNSSVITNQEIGAASLTWNDATFSWDDAEGTWNNPSSFDNQAINSSVISNQTKN